MGRMCRFVTQVYTCHGGLQHPSTRHLYQVFPLMLSLPLPPPRDGPQSMMFPSLCPCVLIVQIPLMSENMWCLIFCSGVSLLRMIFSSFIHVPAKDKNSSFLWLHSIPWCICATFSSSNLPLMGICVPSFCYCKLCCSEHMCTCIFIIE